MNTIDSSNANMTPDMSSEDTAALHLSQTGGQDVSEPFKTRTANIIDITTGQPITDEQLAVRAIEQAQDTAALQKKQNSRERYGTIPFEDRSLVARGLASAVRAAKEISRQSGI